MSYQRDVLGQDWFSDALPDFGPSQVTESDIPVYDYEPAPAWSFSAEPVSPSYTPEYSPPAYEYQPAEIPYSPPLSLPAPQPVSSSWSWESIWRGIEPVIRTGAEAFTKIYPVVTAKTSSGQAQLPAPRAGQQWPSSQPVPPGYRRDPVTGTLIPSTAQAGITASPYFWPVTLGLGAMFLLTSGKAPARRRRR